MGQILQLSKEVLTHNLMDQRKELACLRVNGYVETSDVWVTEIDQSKSGLGFYTQLFEFIRSGGYSTIISSPAEIATLGILSRINPAVIQYYPAAYSGIKKGDHQYEADKQYKNDPSFQAMTFNLIKSLANEIEVSTVWL
jgi:hypothetical protein